MALDAVSGTNPWLQGTWRKRDVLWWVGVTTAVPILGRLSWWAAEKSYNTLTPYQVPHITFDAMI